MSKQTQTAKSQATKSKSNQNMKSKSLEQNDPWASWNDEVRDLTHKLLYENEDGKRWLGLLEGRFMYEPIGTPNQTNEESRFFCGRNFMIRQFRSWIQDKLFGIERSKQKQTVRKRKAT